jgi:hypothetical protein
MIEQPGPELGQVLATRVRKARWTSTCSRCDGPIQIGQRVGYIEREDIWIHVWCCISPPSEPG